MERMILVLTPGREQQKALEELLAEQQDPASSHYHQWLTPAEYARHFAVSDSDLEKVTDWLTGLGFTVDEIPAGRGVLLFSGPAVLVESAFHLRINRYNVNGVPHIANANDPELPSSLAGVVGGVVSLHDFRSQPLHAARIAAPAYTSGSNHYLAPADFAAIYDVAGLYSQYYDGTGQTIAIVGRSNLHLSDIRQFRSSFGLPAKDPAIILNGGDPGTASSGDVSEATLDVEWAGAVAKNATIDFVASASTSVSDGTYLSAQYIVNRNLASVMSVSYGLCEAWLGTAENAFLNSLWQQAAAQGISVFVSSGDSGAAGCDASNAPRATSGRGVNGLCSTPYSTCVGGTRFSDTASPALYWNTTNTSSGSSARGYIPESAWNESGGSGLWSSGRRREHDLREALMAKRQRRARGRDAGRARRRAQLSRARWVPGDDERRQLCLQRNLSGRTLLCGSDGSGSTEQRLATGQRESHTVSSGSAPAGRHGSRCLS